MCAGREVERVNVICHKCSSFVSVELTGRRQQMDCPQCGSFVGEPDREGGLVVSYVCSRCMLAHPIDVLAAKMALVCPGCGATPKVSERGLLRKVAQVHRFRRESHGRPPKSDSGLRVNLAEMEIAPELIARVPGSIALAYRCVPIRFENDVLTVALPEPPSAAPGAARSGPRRCPDDAAQAGAREASLEDLALVLKCNVQGAAARPADVERLLDRYYGRDEGASSA